MQSEQNCMEDTVLPTLCKCAVVLSVLFILLHAARRAMATLVLFLQINPLLSQTGMSAIVGRPHPKLPCMCVVGAALLVSAMRSSLPCCTRVRSLSALTGASHQPVLRWNCFCAPRRTSELATGVDNFQSFGLRVNEKLVLT